MSTGKVVLGVLAGVAAGSILGILFAPDKGSKTIKKVSKIGDDYVNGLKDKFENFLENISEKFESAMEEGTNLVEKGKSKARELKSDHKQMVSDHESN